MPASIAVGQLLHAQLKIIVGGQIIWEWDRRLFVTLVKVVFT